MVIGTRGRRHRLVAQSLAGSLFEARKCCPLFYPRILALLRCHSPAKTFRPPVFGSPKPSALRILRAAHARQCRQCSVDGAEQPHGGCWTATICQDPFQRCAMGNAPALGRSITRRVHRLRPVRARIVLRPCHCGRHACQEKSGPPLADGRYGPPFAPTVLSIGGALSSVSPSSPSPPDRAVRASAPSSRKGLRRQGCSPAQKHPAGLDVPRRHVSADQSYGRG